MRRGEIWWADFPAPMGRRPAILLSRDEAYEVRASVTVVPLTRRVRRIPVEVRLEPRDGVPRTCVANVDNITYVAKALLISRVGPLARDKLRAVEDAIRFALAL